MSTYGIDLGTTYSCIAKLDQNGNPEVIQNFNDGSYTLASAVYFEEGSGNTIYGEAAKSYMETDPDRLIQFVKREIGRPNGKTYMIDGTEYTPIDISALILKKLKMMAEEQGESVTDVIITCPAYFGFEEKEATRTAGELAGLNVMDLIAEPTAAAVSYCYRDFQEDQTVMVYDLGGGTFDVSIMKMSVIKGANGEDRNQIRQVVSRGNDYLGGKDWDDILYSIFIDKFCNESGMSSDDLDDETRQNVRGKIEKTKVTLSSAESAKVRIKSDVGPIPVTVTREEFEEATSHLVAKTMGIVEEALEKAGDIQIDKVLLVGGSTNMPMIKRAVEERFPGMVQVEDPDRAVAKGAAVYSSIIVDTPGPEPIPDPNPDLEQEESKLKSGWGGLRCGDDDVQTIVPQSPRSFGVGVYIGGKYSVDNLIMRDADLPATTTKVYGTMFDGQESVIIRVFESMAMDPVVRPCLDAEGNEQDTEPEYLMKALGQIILELPPNTPKDSKIEVTIMIDAGGVHIEAKNLATGDSVSSRIEYKTSMTDEEKEDRKKILNMLTLED